MNSCSISEAAYLLAQDNILLLTHKNPDGDTLCSAAALCSALRRAGKTAFLYRNPQITDRFVPYLAPYLTPEGYQHAFVVSVDTAAEGLLPQGFTGGEVGFCVDHHPTNSFYAGKTLVLPEKSACAATFACVSRLLACGADNAAVNLVFFRQVSCARVRLEGMIYTGMTMHRGGEVVVATVTREMVERAGASEDDCDDLASLPSRVKGCRAGITIREQVSGESKISVRTSSDVSAVEICRVFGGGGHEMAAGCTIPAGPERAKELLLAVVDEVMK